MHRCMPCFAHCCEHHCARMALHIAVRTACMVAWSAARFAVCVPQAEEIATDIIAMNHRRASIRVSD
eukprot:1139603-Pelagomonas_calceolata.AAC.2